MKELYIKAYKLLEDLTPIPADCGKLCGKRCCKGGKEAGMILFPGEKELIEGYYDIQQQEMGDITVDFAVCKGRCNRMNRPLSCRIFPFAPRYQNGILTVHPDSRARYLCPLLLPQAAEFIDPSFIAAVEEAFRLLLSAEGLDRFLNAYTIMLDEYKRFTEV